MSLQDILLDDPGQDDDLIDDLPVNQEYDNMIEDILSKESAGEIDEIISEIKTGGYYNGGDDENNDNMITLDGKILSNDDILYYLINNKLKNNLAKLPINNDDDLYLLYNKVSPNRYIYKRFIELVNLIGAIEDKISKDPHKNLNISLPTIHIPSDANKKIIYDQEFLIEMINKIIKYVQKLTGNRKDIKLMLADNQKKSIKKVGGVEDNIKKLVLCEKSHCKAINHTNDVVRILKDYLGGLE